MSDTMLPPELINSLKQVQGFDEKTFIDVHASGEQVVSVRFNPFKITDTLPDFGFASLVRVPWSSYGYYLPSRPSFTLDPLLHAGAYYVQEASSMFLEQCIIQTVDVSENIKALDLCAAPGGKSTLIQSVISAGSLLVSNEVIKSRVGVLIENISKCGAVNSIVTNNDPKDFGSRLQHYFDLLVVDAPCSGSGLFRRDPSAIEEWGTDAVTMCSQRQQRILMDAYPALKKNGVLVYSTCSYSVEENENICDWLCETMNVESVSVTIQKEWNIQETVSPLKKAYGYRFFPDKLRGEGFFIACFRKKDGHEEYEENYKKSRLSRLSSSEAVIVSPWLKQPDELNLYHLENEVYAFPKTLEQDLINIALNLYTKKAGVLIGKLLRDELVPAHELALSRLLRDNIVTVSLKKEDALQYLRKEEIIIDTDKKGWALVQYEGMNIGWVKLLQRRANNYYPKEWRILKSGNN